MSSKDLDLVSRAKSGDSAAFEELVVLHQNKIYTLCLRMSGNAEDALDLSQESFLRIYKALPFFKEQSSFSTWAYSIATNVCIDFTRKMKKRKTVPLHVTDEHGEEVLREIPSNLYHPEQEYEKTQLREAIAAGLDSLSPEHREILILREISGLSYQEIGEVLDLESGTVKSRINRARIQLCDFLRNNQGESPSNKRKGR